MRSLRTGGGGGRGHHSHRLKFHQCLFFPSINSFPPSCLPVDLWAGRLPSPPPITLNAVLTHHGKSICVKWNFILAQELMQFIKDVLITLFLMQEYCERKKKKKRKKAAPKTQAGVIMKMFLVSWWGRTHSNWSRFGPSRGWSYMVEEGEAVLESTARRGTRVRRVL